MLLTCRKPGSDHSCPGTNGPKSWFESAGPEALVSLTALLYGLVWSARNKAWIWVFAANARWFVVHHGG